MAGMLTIKTFWSVQKGYNSLPVFFVGIFSFFILHGNNDNDVLYPTCTVSYLYVLNSSQLYKTK